MSITNELDWTPLVDVLRQRGNEMLDREEEGDDIDNDARDTGELQKVLARILDGATFVKAFGAPGDWGYGTPIGKALQTIYRGRTAAKLAPPPEVVADTATQARNRITRTPFRRRRIMSTTLPPIDPHAIYMSGLTIRDYFAAKAMQAIIASGTFPQTENGYRGNLISVTAYRVADSMLEARKNTKPTE